MNAPRLDTTRPQITLGQPVLAGGEALWRADMEPFTVMDDGGEPAGDDSLIPQRIERERTVWRSSEEAAAQNLDAPEEIGHDLTLGAAAHITERIDRKIADAVIADGAGRALHQQEGIEPRRIPGIGETQQRRRAPVQPEHIGIDDEEGFAEMLQRVLRATARIEQRLFVREHDLDIVPLLQMLGHHRRFVMRVDDDALHARSDQPVDAMIDERTAAQRDQRLRRVIRDRPHPRAEAGRKDHRRVDHGFSAGMRRSSGGMLRSSQALTGANTGWRKLPSSSRHSRGMYAR